MSNNDEKLRFKRIALDTLNEEIIQIQKKDYSDLEKKSKIKIDIVEYLSAGIFIFPVLIILTNNLLFLIPTVALMLVSLYFCYKAAVIDNEILCNKVEDHKRIDKLIVDSVELVLDGKIISGTVSHEWCEMIVDHGDNVSKMTVRLSQGKVQIKP